MVYIIHTKEIFVAYFWGTLTRFETSEEFLLYLFSVNFLLLSHFIRDKVLAQCLPIALP